MENIIYQTAAVIDAQVLKRVFFNNTVLDYLIFLGIFLAILVVLKIFKIVLLVKIKKITKKTKTKFDDLVIDIVDSINWPFYLFFALHFSLKFISTPNILGIITYYLLFITGTYYIIKGLQGIVDYGFDRVLEKKEQGSEGSFNPTIILLFKKIAKIILWGLAVIILLQNLGYNISTLVAGLGIGGLAIAFALQNILSDIFASFSIYFDKPFEVGDFIIIGKDKGTVKKIGIKSTRIQALQGEELIVSNQELISSRVHNYKKMKKRRIVFDFGVTYETSSEKLRKIPEIVKEIMEKMEGVDLDRVHFNKFSDFSLNFEIVYYFDSSEYNNYMDVQEEINLSIKTALEKEKISLAYPTQTIFVKK